MMAQPQQQIAASYGMPSFATAGFDYTGAAGAVSKYASLMGTAPTPVVAPPSLMGGPPPTIGAATPIGSGHMTSHTSSKDPNAMKSRVFVGNLNTSIVTREQIQSIYAPFGEIVAISMHKGFAFVQFAHESAARNAVTFTDGSPLCGRNLDVTISCEPKSKTGDVVSSSQKRFANTSGQMGSDTKKPRYGGPTSDYQTTYPGFTPQAPVLVSVPTTGSAANESVTSALANYGISLTHAQLSSHDDLLICGKCRKTCTSIDAFTEHKRQCGDGGGAAATASSSATDKSATVAVKQEQNGDASNKQKPVDEPEQLRCFICHSPFEHSWNLLLHMHDTHSMKVYEHGPTDNGKKA